MNVLTCFLLTYLRDSVFPSVVANLLFFLAVGQLLLGVGTYICMFTEISFHLEVSDSLSVSFVHFSSCGSFV